MTTVGTHTIGCTASSGAGKNIVVTTTLTVTYTAYTATNLIINGSFEDSTSNWNIAQPADGIANIVDSNKQFGNYSLLLDISSPNAGTYVDSNAISTPIDHYYYFSIHVYIPRITAGYFMTGELWNEQKTGFTFGYNPNISISNSSWTKYSVYLKNNSAHQTSVYRIGVYNGDSSYSDGTAYFDGIIGIDLTETFGSGNEPDKEWCDRRIQYFDGTTTIYK